MKIAGTYLKPKGHLNGSQIDYIKSRLNSIIQEINVEIYQISVQNVEITESQEIWIDIYRGMHPAAIIKIVNGSHEVKKKEYNQVDGVRSEEHTSELQSRGNLVCRLLREKKNRRAHKARDSGLSR